MKRCSVLSVMKILAASDIHGEIESIRKLVEKAKKYDVDLIVLGGDITHFEMKLEGIIGELKKAEKPIIMVPGNEESIATLDFLVELYSPSVYNIHAYAIRFGDVGIVGIGGATRVGPHFVTEREVWESLVKGFQKIKDKKIKIILAHEPPDNTKLSLKFGGSKALREFIEKYSPDIVICGHIHESQGMIDIIGKTIIINPGPEGMVIDLEKLLVRKDVRVDSDKRMGNSE